MEFPKTMYLRICRDEDGEFPVSGFSIDEMMGEPYRTYQLIEERELTGENG